VLKYAGVDVSAIPCCIVECSSISTLEWAWNHYPWGKKDTKGNVTDLVLLGSCCNEQTRVPQVGERSETVRVG
jgi:hypothetical protein